MTPGPAPVGTPMPARRPRRSRGNRAVTMIGILLLVLGLICLGYVGYQLFGTNVSSHRAYQQERELLRQQWQQPPAEKHGKTDPPVPGDAIALMSIPAIGVKDVPVLEGTSDDILARGIGHYRSTADPGQIGNFAVAGHRITHGEPFAKLLELDKGDRVIVETRTTVYTYRLDTSPKKLTVEDTEGWVLDPVPGHPRTKPTKRMITLTTCQDLFHSPDRSVGFGHLVGTRTKR